MRSKSTSVNDIPGISLRVMTAFVLLITLPLILLISCPLFIYRFFIGKLAPILHPEFGKLLSSRGCIFATDDIHGVPKCNLLVSFTVGGNFEIEAARELCQRNLIEAKCSDGSLKYPELKQYITMWNGYYFTTNDYNFDINEHIKLHKTKMESSLVSAEELEELRQSLVEKGWPIGKSPWEVIFIPNCSPVEGTCEKYTTIFLRFHHSGGDGYSLLFLCLQGLCQKPIEENKILYSPPKRSYLSRAIFTTLFPFRCTYEMADIFFKSKKEISHGLWRIRENPRNHKFHINLAPKLSVQIIKEIKSHFKVSFTSVIFASVANSIRNILIKMEKEIPETIPCLIPLPVPKHSLKLRNEMTGGIVDLPLGDMSPLSRLQFCYEEYERVQRSTLPVINMIIPRILGQYSPRIVRRIARNCYSTTGISNFPGSLGHLEINGFPIIDASFFAGLQVGIAGLGFGFLSFADGLRISAFANASAMTKMELDELTEAVGKHIKYLHNIIIEENIV